MPDIYGAHFEYGDKSSRLYDLVLANAETERIYNLEGQISGINFYNRSNNKRYLIDDDKSGSALSFDIDIVTKETSLLTPVECREIEKWLFNRRGYKKLYIDRQDDDGSMSEFIDGIERRLYLNCRFSNPQRIEGNGGVVGFRATLEADTGMFWQDEVTYAYTLNSSPATITVPVDSDPDDYIYPNIRIVMKPAGGDVTIYNNTDDNTRLTQFSALSASEIVNMRGDLRYVSPTLYQNFTAQNFIRLLDGENSLVVTGNVASIEITFSNRRFL